MAVLAVLVAGGWVGWQHFSGDDGGKATTAPTPKPCPSPKFRTTLPKHPAPVDVFNGTRQDGLAHHVARVLRADGGLPVGQVDNSRKPLHGTSVVRYPSVDRLEAWIVAARTAPPARLMPAPNARRVQLTIGSSYRRLASPSEFTGAVHAFAQRALGCAADTIHVAG